VLYFAENEYFQFRSLNDFIVWILLSDFRYRITLHGFPTATQFAGIDFVTTLPAPITLPVPIVMPARIILPPPIHTLSSTVIGRDRVRKKSSPEFSFQFSTNLSL